MTNDEIIVQKWGKVRCSEIPFNLHKVIKSDEKFKMDSEFGPLGRLANFASRSAGSISRFVDEKGCQEAFSFSLRESFYCGRSMITSFLYVAKRDENLLKAKLTDYATFEGTPYHYDSIHYVVEKLDEHAAKGAIYRLGFPGAKLDDFVVRIFDR